jgi:large subunit ribosomal protein L28
LAKCDLCGKTKQFGRHIRHAHSIGWALRAPKKNRVFEPNVHKTRLMLEGRMQRKNVCTRCLRTMQKT